MWRATFRGLLAHRVRLVATAVAVVLGVTFVAGTFVLTDTLRASIDATIDQALAHIAVQVEAKPAFSVTTTGNEGGGGLGDLGLTIPASAATAVARVPGVAASAAVDYGLGTLEVPGAKAPQHAVAYQVIVSMVPNHALSGVTVRAGHAPRHATQVVVDLATAQRDHLHLGQRVEVAAAGPARPYTLVGLVGYGTETAPIGTTLIGLTLPATESILDQPGRISEVVASARPGVSATVLRARVARAVGPTLRVRTATQIHAQELAQVNKGFALVGDIFLVFAGIALFVAVFLIFNTFSILLTQRTRELALLRCLGASRRQLVQTVLAESGAIGAVASLIGLGLGIALALGIRLLIQHAGVSFPSTSPVVEPRTVVVALVVGTLATMVAALVPALRGARTAPVAAMRDEVAVDVGRAAPLRIATGIVLLVVGALAVVSALHGGGGKGGDASDRAAMAGIGLALGFLGVGALMPLVARPLAGVLGWPAAALRGIPGKLGRNNAMRHPRRTASTAAALMIGLTLVTTVAVMSRSIEVSVDGVLQTSLHADYVVTPVGTLTSIPTSLAPALVHVHGLTDVAAVASEHVRILLVRDARTALGRPMVIRSTRAQAVATDVAAYRQDVSVPTTAGTFAHLGADDVAVTTGIAQTWHLGVGSTVPIASAQVARRTFRVTAVYEDPTGFTGDLLFGAAGLASLFPQNGPKVTRVLARLAPGASAAAATVGIDRVLRAYPQAQVLTKAGFIDHLNTDVNNLLGVLTALLLISVVIAFFGVVNTLALAVVERRREIGLLRALGMSRGQLREAVRWESVIVALLGTVLGIALGLVFARVVVGTLSADSVTSYAVPVVELVVYVVVAALAGVAAAVIPARTSARVDVLEAIAEL